MSRPYAELFAESRARKIEIADGQLYAMVELTVPAPISLNFVRVVARADRPQGLVIDTTGHPVSVETCELERVILWSDTAPTKVALDIDGPGPVTLRLWNTWRDGDTAHAWVGWAAIKLETEGSALTFRCSDGHDDGGFDDLVIEVDTVDDQTSGLLTSALQ